MYPSKYKSVFRIHTMSEALAYPMKNVNKIADLFLYLLDTYDLCLSYAEGSHPGGQAQPEDFDRLREKLESWAAPRFEMLQDTIPGTLKGFNQGMFIYVICCMCRLLALTPTSFNLSFDEIEWVRNNRVRMFLGNSTAKLSYSGVLDAMDAVTKQWKTCEKSAACAGYLDALENRAALLVTQTLSASDLDMPFLRMDAGGGRYQLHPTGLFDIYSTFECTRRSLRQYHMFDVMPSHVELGEHRWEEWLAREQRHLTVRKFRDNVETDVQWAMLRPSEWIRASYAQRGSKVSPFVGLAGNQPLAALDALNNKCAYAEPPELYDDDRIVNTVHLNIVHATFMSMYTVSFKDFFYCEEEKSWKHVSKMPHAMVPFVLQRAGRFDTMYKGKLLQTPNGMFYEAFLIWLQIVRVELHCRCYNGAMDFTRICKEIFEKPIVIAKRETGGASEYQWD